ncbi:MAG: MATE family efflux transporter, partial [Calditrichaeota bacterium]
MEHQQIRRLQDEAIPKLLWRFSLPAIIGTFFNSLYNIVDRIFIGQGVGADGLAAATVAFPIMMMIMAVGMLIGFGSNALISIHLGEKNKEAAQKILNQAVFLFVAFSGVFMILGNVFLTPLLRIFGAGETILPLARDYTSIIIWGVLANIFSFGVNNFIRGEGNPRIAMVTLIVGALLNMVLDPLFIFVFHLGMRGAAWATVLAQAVSAFWVLAYYLRGTSILKLRLGEMRFSAKLTKKVAAIGSPMFVMNAANVFILMFVNQGLSKYGGDLAIAAMGVIFTVHMVNFMPIIGLSQGVQPIIGYNYGARNFSRVRETLILAVNTTTLWGCFATALIFLFPRLTFLPFSHGNEELIRLGSHAIPITLSQFPFIGLMVITGNYF